MCLVEAGLRGGCLFGGGVLLCRGWVKLVSEYYHILGDECHQHGGSPFSVELIGNLLALVGYEVAEAECLNSIILIIIYLFQGNPKHYISHGPVFWFLSLCNKISCAPFPFILKT